jgi:hypothetical protein
MGRTYLGELASLSPGDFADIQAVYPTGKSGAYAVSLAPRTTIAGLNFGTHKLPPVIVLPAVQRTLSAGQAALITLGTLSESGTGNDPRAVDVTWGDGQPNDAFSLGTTNQIAATHNYTKKGSYTVVVKVRDRFGSTGFTTYTQVVQ